MFESIYQRIQRLINRGQQAQLLVDNPAYQEAVQAVQSAYIGEIISSGLGDQDKREQLYLAIRALADVNSKLGEYISEAKYQEGLDQRNNPQTGE